MALARGTVCILLAVGLAACGPSEQELREAEAAQMREQQRKQRAAEHAARLKERFKEVAETTATKLAEAKESLAEIQADPKVKNAAAYPEVAEDLKRLASIVESATEVQSSALEGRVTSILEPALEGFLATGEIRARRTAALEEAMNQVREALIRDTSSDDAYRDMKINQAMTDLTTIPLAVFATTIELLAQDGPDDVRRPAFQSITAALPQAPFGRSILENALRNIHREEEDPATKASFESAMTELGVPLTAPEEEGTEEDAPAATDDAALAEG